MTGHNTVREHFAGYVRNFIFGVEDSLVSTVGLLSGVAVAGMERQSILLTGVVLIFVEAFSMGVGSYLSEQSAEEYVARRRVRGRFSIVASIIMFVSYFLAGFIPLLPYIFWPAAQAFVYSIAASLIGLAILGLAAGRVLKSNLWLSTIRMFFIGSLAIIVGVVIGQIFKI